KDLNIVAGADPGGPGLVVAGAAGALADGTLEDAADRRGNGVGASCHAAQGGADEDLEDDVGGDGVARAAEDEGSTAAAEGERLPGLDGDLVEQDFHAERTQCGPHEVVRSHRNAAGQDEDVVAQTILDHESQPRFFIRSDAE